MTKTNIIALFVTCIHTAYSVSFTSSRDIERRDLRLCPPYAWRLENPRPVQIRCCAPNALTGMLIPCHKNLIAKVLLFQQAARMVQGKTSAEDWLSVTCTIARVAEWHTHPPQKRQQMRVQISPLAPMRYSVRVKLSCVISANKRTRCETMCCDIVVTAAYQTF